MRSISWWINVRPNAAVGRSQLQSLIYGSAWDFCKNISATPTLWFNSARGRPARQEQKLHSENIL
ncbi:hypothetical protein RCH09_001143 [Actimicrobium sp. GrIS 1.19]|uniref:hypothetical protein n=1 Tax=Actimicrobium sp. GrIS 1.19 TaxID=3071708 RepID=UPI002DFB31D9|nr:hypothetical protein [Actimicrobium sp. GrIS 1.19]